jgi:DNA ligase-1
MKTYPTLYSRTSTGATQIWYCQQEKNGKYRSISGQLDGVKTFSEFTQAEPKNIGKKNETNAEKQAELEIQAKYKRQLKSGGYFENIKDIDKKLFISPMLAHKWEDRSDEINWKNGNYISPKMDGIRCIINKDGAFSRNGEKFVSFPHILEQLKVLFNDNPDLVLDGEIYCDKLCNDFNKIISLARKTKPKKEDLEESKKFIQYWIFDSPSLQGGFHERYDKLITICLYYFLNNQYVKLCKHKLIYKVGK